MLTGSGHEPHHLPELDGSFAASQPPQRMTVVVVAAVGSAIATLIWIVSRMIGADFFGGQQPFTAEELTRRSRLAWLALAVFVVTTAVALLIARRVDASWSVRVGSVVLGAVAGVALCIAAIIAWVGAF